MEELLRESLTKFKNEIELMSAEEFELKRENT